MAQNSWLDDNNNGLPPNPWEMPVPPPTTPLDTAAQAPAPVTPPPADTGSWADPATNDTQQNAPAPAGDYTQDVSPRSTTPGQVQAGAGQGGVTGVGPGDPAQDVARYQSQLDAVHHASDPQSKAAAQDALARQLQQDMEADGHKVTWKGNVMVIDGRPYELAGEGVTSGTFGGPGGYGNPTGFEQSRLNNPTDNDPKTVFGRWVASMGGQITGDDVRAFVASDPRWEINPASSPNDPQIRVKQTALDTWKPGTSYWQDPIRDAGPGGANAGQFENAAGSGPGYAPTTADSMTGWLDNRGLRGGAGSTPGGVPGGPSWMDLYRMGSEPTALDNQLDAFSSNLLANPDTLSERDVQTLKGQSAEEAAVAAQQADEELQHFGYQTGLDSSPWLAGQRAQNDWNRKQTTITSNRNVDIAAADRRMSDRKEAASIATQWAQLSHEKKQQALNTATDYLKASMGYDIDLKKLDQQDEQFKADLVYRIKALQQADDQFRANYGLDSQKLSHTIDQDYWERGKAAANPPA